MRWALAVLLLAAVVTAQDESGSGFLRWQRGTPVPDAIGLAGPFAGTHRGALLVAGGAILKKKMARD